MLRSFNKEKSYKFIIWTILALFYILQYILRLTPTTFYTFISNTSEINEVQMGQILAIYYGVYSFAHIPLGLFLDRIGIEKMLISSLLGTLIGVLLIFKFYDIWLVFFLGRLILGLSTTVVFVMVIKVSMLYFKRPMLSISSIAFLGVMLSGNVNKLLVNYYGSDINGWESVNYFLIFFVVFLLVFSTILLKINFKKEDIVENNNNGFSIKSSFLKLFKNKNFVICCFIALLSSGITEGFADGWANRFFSNIYSYVLTENQISYLVPTIMTSFACGTLFGSIVVDFTGKDYAINIISQILAIISFIILIMVNLIKDYQIFILSAVIGFFSLNLMTIISLGIKQVPREYSGLAASLINNSIMLGGYFFHSITGFIFRNTNTLIDFQYTLSIIPVSLLISIILSIFIYINSNSIK